jgi:hypothetical protein
MALGIHQWASARTGGGAGDGAGGRGAVVSLSAPRRSSGTLYRPTILAGVLRCRYTSTKFC